MRLVWTRSTHLSKKWSFISVFLREPVDHFAIEFFSTNKRYLHWNLSGFHDDDEKTFFKNRKAVFTKEYHMKSVVEQSVHDTMVDRHKGSHYDYAYLLWLIWRSALLLVGIKIPEGEPFGDTTNNMICHEALEGLPRNVRPKYDSDKANTPYRLYQELTKK